MIIARQISEQQRSRKPQTPLNLPDNAAESVPSARTSSILFALSRLRFPPGSAQKDLHQIGRDARYVFVRIEYTRTNLLKRNRRRSSRAVSGGWVGLGCKNLTKKYSMSYEAFGLPKTLRRNALGEVSRVKKF